MDADSNVEGISAGAPKCAREGACAPQGNVAVNRQH